MSFDPQLWLQVGVIGVAFGWLLHWTTRELGAALERNTQAISDLSRQVRLNTILVARMSGQHPADLERMLADHDGH